MTEQLNNNKDDMVQPQTLHRCLNSICRMDPSTSQLLGMDKCDKFDKGVK